MLSIIRGRTATSGRELSVLFTEAGITGGLILPGRQRETAAASVFFLCDDCALCDLKLRGILENSLHARNDD